MNKAFVTAVSVLLTISLCGQSERTVLMEEFTQASCWPCMQSNPVLNAIMSDNQDKAIQIRYHVHWPGTDPMNADNPEEVRERDDYYGVNGVPWVELDGRRQVSSYLTQSQINTAHNRTAPVLVEIDHQIDEALTTLSVQARISNEGNNTFSNPNARLRIAIIEKDVTWNQPPGATLLTRFEAVFKTFIGGNQGTVVPTIAAGASEEFTWEFTLPKLMYNLNKMAIVAFVQDDSNKYILNAAESAPQLIPGPYVDLDYGELENSETIRHFCDPIFRQTMVFGNIGDRTVVDPFIVSYDEFTFEAVDTLQLESEIEPNYGLRVTLPVTDLPIGTTGRYFAMESDEVDLNNNNNFSSLQHFIRLSEDHVPGLEEGFENLEDRYYNNYAIDRPSKIFPGSVNDRLIGG